MTAYSPEHIAAIWQELERQAARIQHEETRAQYLTAWRAKYDEFFPRWLSDTEIVTLPDWEHVGEISPREKRLAAKVSEDWLYRQKVDVADDAQVKRFSFEIGRRVAAGFMSEAEGDDARLAMLGDAGKETGARAAWARGRRVSEGQALLASIVLDMRCAVQDRNEAGLAERFRLRYGHNFLHTTAKGWFRWDGKRWQMLDEERGAVPAELLAAAYDTVAAIQREAMVVRATGLAKASIPEGMDQDAKVETAAGKVALGDIETEAEGLDGLIVMATTCRLLSVALGRWGNASGELKRYKAMVDISRRWLTASVLDFDTDPMTINCQNGTLRLIKHIERDDAGAKRTRVEAVLTPHRREDRLTRVASVPYDPDATCPNYDATLEWAQPMPHIRRYIHQWGGYSLTGDMGLQIFQIWWGPQAQNGKSTILDAWANVAGDYAAAGKIETFMEAAAAKSGDAATPALAALPGVRMLRTGEPPSGSKFDESLINTITGEDPLMIRALHRGFYEVKMQFKVTVACNEMPGIPKATEGIKRRVKVVRFDKTMKGALKPDGTPLRDPKFKEKLVSERPGIFKRLIEGALDWLANDIIEPGEVQEWTDEYKDDNDPLGQFLSYCTVPDPAGRVQASLLHEVFIAYGKAAQGPDWSPKYLAGKLKAKGFSNKASNGMKWLGIRLVKSVRDFVDENGKVIELSDVLPPQGQSAATSDAPPPLDPWTDDDDIFGNPSGVE